VRHNINLLTEIVGILDFRVPDANRAVTHVPYRTDAPERRRGNVNCESARSER